MKLLPYHKFIVEAPMLKEEAIVILRKAVFTKLPPWFYIRGPFDYFAKFQGDRFTAYRLLDTMRANSFNPILHGRFIQVQNITEVHIQVFPALIVILFVSLTWGSLIFFWLRDLFYWLTIGEPIRFSPALFVVPIMLYLFMVIPFAAEVKKAENFLHDLYKQK